MRIQCLAVFSPAGLGAQATTQPQRMSGHAVSAAHAERRQAPQQQNDATRAELGGYDDGLVHGHFWAMSSTTR